MELNPKGIKWKLKIYSSKWYQNMIKTIMFTTIKRGTKKASLNIYVLRSIYYIVSVCIIFRLFVFQRNLKELPSWCSWQSLWHKRHKSKVRVKIADSNLWCWKQTQKYLQIRTNVKTVCRLKIDPISLAS